MFAFPEKNINWNGELLQTTSLKTQIEKIRLIKLSMNYYFLVGLRCQCPTITWLYGPISFLLLIAYQIPFYLTFG